MRGMVLAAGLGTRLRPVTFTMPKPMVPLCNYPLIGYAIRSLLRAGVRQIVVNTHHLPEQIERWVRTEFGASADLAFSFEPEILGTGGGVRNVRHHLEGDDFFLLNGDTVQNPPLEALAAARRQGDALAALLLRRPPAHDRFTPVFFDGEKVTGFGNGTGEALMFAGCHAISSEVFRWLPERPVSGIVEDVYVPVTKSRDAHLAAVVDDGFWFDIGTPLRYWNASMALRELIATGSFDVATGSSVHGRSIVHSTATVRAEIDDSVVGAGSIVAESNLVRSAVWDEVEVARGCRIIESVLASGVVLPPRSVAENALVARRPEVPYDAAVSDGDLIAVPIDPAKPFYFERGR